MKFCINDLEYLKDLMKIEIFVILSFQIIFNNK